jgi:hypothetical protein
MEREPFLPNEGAHSLRGKEKQKLHFSHLLPKYTNHFSHPLDPVPPYIYIFLFILALAHPVLYILYCSQFLHNFRCLTAYYELRVTTNSPSCFRFQLPTCKTHT